MSKAIKYIAIFISFSFIFGGTYFAYRMWRSMEDGGYLSCIASVASKIEKSDKGKRLAKQNKDWKILNDEELNSLMSQIQGGDCGKYPNQTLDIWNRKINVALRKPKDRIEIIIWSNGQDGVLGTDDDLVIPWGEKAPK